MLSVTIANIRFRCPVSGLITRTGDVCAEDEMGNRLHISQLPARRLRPLQTFYKGDTTPSVSGADISPHGGRRSTLAQ